MVIPVDPCLWALWKPCKGKLAKVEVLLWVEDTTLEQLLSATPKPSLMEYYNIIMYCLEKPLTIFKTRVGQLTDNQTSLYILLTWFNKDNTFLEPLGAIMNEL